MNLKQLQLLALLFSFSCTLTRPAQKISHRHYPLLYLQMPDQEIDVLVADLDFLSSQIKFSEFSQFLSRHHLIINYSDTNCRNDQISCFYPQHSETIYINDKFFDLSRLERIGSILHELHHRVYKSSHVSCPADRNPLSDCDRDSNGAYGIELSFYNAAVNSSLKRDAHKAIQKNQLRILNNHL